MEPIYNNTLKLGTLLNEYRLESMLGMGGFGLTYLAWDTHLEKNVAIKEYLPGDLAVRALDGSVVPVSSDHQHDYKWGLDRFIMEARTLAKFSHGNIVRVNRYFEANGTGYMVMDYEEGESLSQRLKRTPQPPETDIIAMLMPLLDGLTAVHEAGFLHRDIKPSNIFIRKNGSPVLLDFGAARHAVVGHTKSLTAVLTPGFAPIEQYTNEGRQGPWSDLYAMSGVVFRAMTNQNPPDAVSRLQTDKVHGLLNAVRDRYSELHPCAASRRDGDALAAAGRRACLRRDLSRRQRTGTQAPDGEACCARFHTARQCVRPVGLGRRRCRHSVRSRMDERSQQFYAAASQRGDGAASRT